LFDTELAARMANLERVGLGSSCESLLGLRLAKEHSAVDWSIRPLREDWLNYAALDVDVLLDLRDAMEKLLFEQGKSNWAEQEFEHAAKFTPKPTNPDKWRTMSGLSGIKDAVVLAVAKNLWEAREALAIKLDVSPGRLVPDLSLVQAATAKHPNRAALAADRKFAGRASQSYLDTWWAAIEKGMSTRDLPTLRGASSGIPNHRSWPQKYPDADARLKSARIATLKLAEDLNIPVENLVSPDSVRQICWAPQGFDEAAIRTQLQSLGARQWQIDHIAAPIAEAISSAVADSGSE
jgi:ribonuclease D